LTHAIAHCIRTRISGGSTDDCWANEGDDTEISEVAKRRAAMVLSDPLDMGKCKPPTLRNIALTRRTCTTVASRISMVP
jgi:predicted nuclease of predicted toxin-antitoxin system